jgi:hypothetical protein
MERNYFSSIFPKSASPKISKMSFSLLVWYFWKRIYPSSRVPFSTKVIARLSLSVFLEHLDDQETKRKKNVEQEKKTKVE